MTRLMTGIFNTFTTAIALLIALLLTVTAHAETSSKQLSTVATMDIHHFIYDGATLFSSAELDRVVASFLNRKISADELQQARQLLTQWYIKHGYINSGVEIPDQVIDNHTIHLKVTEGHLLAIKLHGNNKLNNSYILDRLASATDPSKPLNIQRLQQKLLLMRQNPLINTINAELTPGLHPGEANMNLKVTEAPAWFATLSANNQSPPAVGSYRGAIMLGNRNLTGMGDTLQINYARSSGAQDYGASYAVPLNRYDTTLKLQSALSQALIISDQFNQLDIRSQFHSYRADLEQPIVHTLNRDIALGIGFEFKRNNTSLLGIPFSFSAGVINGVSKTKLLHLYQSWTEKGAQRVIAVRSTFGLGLRKDAAVTPDGKFLTWLGQFQWIERLHDNWGQLVWRTDLRLSNDNLPITEKFVLGGQQTVRGYRENLLTADGGMVAGIAWHIPIGHAHIAHISRRAEDGAVTLQPFIDFGQIWNQKIAAPAIRQIASVGATIHWQLNSAWFIQIDGAKGLKKVNSPGKYDLQDNGVHFMTALTL
ncbi:MAG: ShlB/FhaC/HecB family hemolysin secretion/activation protein [Mariprofundales bacterium]